MKTGKDLSQELIRLFAEQVRRFEGQIGPETKWCDIADSLDQIEIILRIEDVYSVIVPDADVADMKTVGDSISYLQKRIK